MDFGNLNTGMAAEAASTDEAAVAGFVAPYDVADDEGNALGVVQRMFYGKRRNSARQLPEETGIEASVLDRFLSATGAENNVPRKARFAARVFFNYNRQDGSAITRDVPASIIRASYIFDVDVDENGSMKPVLRTMVDWLDVHGYVTKGKMNRYADNTRVAVPLVADLNSIRLSKSGQNYVCKAAATAYINAGNGNQDDFRVDVRIPDTNIKVADFQNACEKVIDGKDVKTRAQALSFVQTAVLLALSAAEDLRIAQGTQEARLPRDIYRMFGMALAECYFGKAEFSTNEENHGYHALLGGVFDLATMGGNWENVPGNRVVAGAGWNVTVLNNQNR
jgi:hypothetical protein